MGAFKQIIPFSFDQHDVRVIERDGEPWFVARDVALVLGYSNPAEAIRTHCKGVSEIRTPTSGGVQSVRIIPERDVYRLVMRSKLPAAEAFEEWVVGTVLPSIRKTGSYAVQHQSAPAPTFKVPTTLAGALRLAAEQAEAIERQQQLLEEQRPKVEFVERYVDAGGAFGFRQTAKLLGANENDFRAFLIDKRIMYRLGGVLAPYQQHIDAGRFDIKTGVSTSSTHVYAQAKFTPKGVQWVAGLWMAAQLPEQVKA
ncbi:anti-repressor Ant [Ralstonia phage Claudette]|uniref:Bro-N domain-containing protein n=2 Tax=Gervaisevirus claudettte TaxID=2846041 RepID=A0A7G5B858_9CAUD|nr:anti-repressor Ant [Ralstonia phage Claudette]QMV32481.1 hypothetical protein 20A_00032 [Ralstonia phage Alix]QPD96369.1 hypothetical protein 20Ca_00051 [Ralstonia phage Claudette]